uniref:Uncharacterized protein n=1 Tax=Anguilla anguilla TaxID=7936 RepID=A0A0E9T7G4_ANGAN
MQALLWTSCNVHQNIMHAAAMNINFIHWC